MTDSEKVFHQISKKIPDGVAGKMFGAKCIKSSNGKTAAFFWHEDMVFKLDRENQEEALKLNGSKIGTHLYAPEKQMKGWVSISKKHSNRWIDFTKEALKYVEGIKTMKT